MSYYNLNEQPREEKMDEETRHPFAITCCRCGSNSVKVIAYEYKDLCIICKSCGVSIECGTYHTDFGDYSETII